MVAATGVGSGLDIEGLVTQLVNAERAPAENRLLQRETRLTSELSAFGTLQGALSGVQSSLSSLSSLSTFNQRSAATSNSAVLTATASADAATNNYSIEVDQLARSQSLASGSFSELTDVVGEGELSFRFGTTSYTGADPGPESYDGFALNGDRASSSITIDSSNNTLQGVRDAINEAEIGVSAAIVNDGSGFRLLLSSQQTGADNSIEVQVDDTGDGGDTDTSGLSRLAFNAAAAAANGGVANLTQTVAAQDASFSINGLSLASDSNTVSEALGGVNLTLTGTTDGTPETLTVSDNSGAVRGAIEGFVNAFNNFASTAGNLTAYNADSGVAGALQGDFTARSVINQVRSVLSGAAEGFDGPFSSLSELGITTQADGRLQINSATLDTALADNFESVVGVFAQLGVSSDSGVEVSSTTSNSQVGSYAVNVSQLASQSALTGAAIGSFPVTIDGTNDSFAISINGVSSGSLSLTQASYANGTELAAELQSRINGASALADGGISVSVSFNGSNQLEIRSDRFGSDSSVEITSLEDGAAFGLSLAVGSTAVDVAGTIGGVAATGVGQRLIGASGDPSEGVNLLITGATLGDRGTVNVSQGIAAQLDNLLSQFLQSNGLFDLRADGLQSSVERLGEDREVLDRRLEALEGRYRRQFNALDTLLANLQSTGDFISTQLAAIPLPGSNNN